MTPLADHARRLEQAVRAAFVARRVIDAPQVAAAVEAVQLADPSRVVVVCARGRAMPEGVRFVDARDAYVGAVQPARAAELAGTSGATMLRALGSSGARRVLYLCAPSWGVA